MEMNVRSYVVAQRKLKRVSQKEMAFSLGISESQLRNIEKGRSVMTVEFLQSYSKVLGMNLVVVMFES